MQNGVSTCYFVSVCRIQPKWSCSDNLGLRLFKLCEMLLLLHWFYLTRWHVWHMFEAIQNGRVKHFLLCVSRQGENQRLLTSSTWLQLRQRSQPRQGTPPSPPPLNLCALPPLLCVFFFLNHFSLSKYHVFSNTRLITPPVFRIHLSFSPNPLWTVYSRHFDIHTGALNPLLRPQTLLLLLMFPCILTSHVRPKVWLYITNL